MLSDVLSNKVLDRFGKLVIIQNSGQFYRTCRNRKTEGVIIMDSFISSELNTATV